MLFFCASALFTEGKKQKDYPYIPAELDSAYIPRIGIAPFTAPSEALYVLQDTRAIRNKVTEIFKNSGFFYVEQNQFVESILKQNNVTPVMLNQLPIIQKLRDSPLNTLHFLVFGTLEIFKGQYRVTLRLLDLDKAMFTVTQSALMKPNGPDMSAGITLLTNRFMKAIDTIGIPPKGKLRPSDSVEYEIGDMGPGGGIVFFKKGNSKDGWRYLEVAPPGTEFSAPWGFFENGVYGPDGFVTELGLGAGRLNTHTIIARMDASNRTGSAAQIVRRLSVGGYDDWYIPSKEEMELIWYALAIKGVGGFSRAPYWTSSQSDYPYVWFFDFRDGRQYYNGNKPSIMRVRAIRAF
jgi:hypothetical protein